MIDIIIPVLNEEKILTEKREYYQFLKSKANIIFADGGSTDNTAGVAREYGYVISSPAGRGIQKNRGARKSKAGRLLFLHVDTFITEHALAQMNRVMDDGAAGGCLTMRIQDERFIFRIYEQTVNMRARVFGILDGDLGLFIRRDVFDRLGCFDLLPVMEDLTFARKLCQAGLIKVLPEPILVSSRKWHERGFARTFWEYTKAYFQLWTGQLRIDNIRNPVITGEAKQTH